MDLNKLLLLLFLGIRMASAQKAEVTERKFSFLPADRTDTVHYTIPVVRLPDKKLADLINRSIKKQVFESEIETGDEAIDSLVILAAGNSLTGLGYEVYLNNYGLLSIEFQYEGMGAHPIWWKTYFNCDLTSGRVLTLEDVIRKEQLSNFSARVLQDKRAALKEHRKELNERMEAAEIDTATHRYVLDYIKENCYPETRTSEFLLSEESLFVFDPCELMHAIQSLAPTIDLVYPWPVISKLLTPFIRQKPMQRTGLKQKGRPNK